jgi:hypothetical protein
MGPKPAHLSGIIQGNAGYKHHDVKEANGKKYYHDDVKWILGAQIFHD